MKLEFWLARRFLSRKEVKFLKLISFITIAGVAIGVMALIVVISVMNGFDKNLEEKILGINSDLLVKADPYIREPQEAMKKISEVKGILHISPVVVGNGNLYVRNSLVNVYIKGIDLKEEIKTTNLGKYFLERIKQISSQGIIVGKELAKKLDLHKGSEVQILIPFELQTYTFKVEGIFESGMYDYDLSLVYINLKKAEEIFSLAGVTALELKIKNPYEANRFRGKVRKKLGGGYYVLSWMDLNKNLFSALKLEKTAMFIILCLIILVASFNIASVLIMMVLEKTKDIGIMRAIGMKKSAVKRVFIFQGMLIGFTGIFSGSVMGGILIYILKNYPIIKLPPDIYYIRNLPVAASPVDFLLIISAALVITFLATLYPAVRASKFDPVVSLRYE